MIDNYAQGSVQTYGLTASTPQIPYAVEIARAIKRVNPSAKVILGGPHCTLMHTAAKREQIRGLESGDRATEDVKNLLAIFDVLVCGDGELAIFEALKIDSGVVDADDSKSDLFLSKQQFSEFPMPARH